MSAPQNAIDPNEEQLAPVYRAAIAVMTWGFRIGAALLVVGLAVAAAKRESIRNEVDPFADILPKIFDGEAAGIIDLAIVVLMATPLLTVIAVALAFRRAGDRRYANASLMVLGVLAISVILSLLR
ncbi:MAG: DUF1634 domain-containing protein [Thermomicrobiales bacterium]|nr:DUF1634 domain-containing protein [Thermomicrobiales bacterium]